MLTVESTSVALMGAALAVGLLIHLVWMGLALGAVLRKLDAPAAHAWIPVLRWIAAARAGLASTIAVAVARGAALLGGVVAVSALSVATFTRPANSEDILLIAVLSGTLLWLAGSLVGWLLWIYGAGTIQMRMRAPRGLTWIAALWPVIWASVLGWGKYRVYGGPAVAAGLQPPVAQEHVTTASSLPLPVRQQPEETPVSVPSAPVVPSASPPPPTPQAAPREPSPGRVSPFATLAPEQLRPDQPHPDQPHPTSAPSPTPTVDAPSPPPPATSPEPEPEPEPEPPVAPLAPAPDTSPYVAKLSPYLATPQEGESVPDTPDVSASPALPPVPSPAHDHTSASAPSDAQIGTDAPAVQAEATPAASLDSWVERMRQTNAPAQESPLPPEPDLTTAPPKTPPPAPVQPEPDQPAQPEPVAPSPALPEPTPPPPPAAPQEDVTGASAPLPVISPPPASPPQETNPAPPADDDQDEADDHTVVVRRAAKSWVLKVGNASYSIGDSSVVIGRATAASRPGVLGIADTTKTMSKRHAELIRRADSWWVRDLGSTNGTYIRAADGTERRIEGPDSQIVDGDLILGDLVATIATAEAH